VRCQELRPPAAQERAAAVAADLDAPHPAERADHEGRGPRCRPFASAAVGGVEAPGEVVGNALHAELINR
jgi:hypothetical protein